MNKTSIVVAGVRVWSTSWILVLSAAASIDLLAARSLSEIELKPGEEIVLLPGESATQTNFPIRNFKDTEVAGDTGGYCFGVMKTQHALLTNARFDADAARDSDEEVYAKLLKSVRDGALQTINGFKNAKEFLNHYYPQGVRIPLSPPERVIKEIQLTHSVQITPSGEMKNLFSSGYRSLGAQRKNVSHRIFSQNMTDPIKLRERFIQAIDQKTPLLLSSFEKTGEREVQTIGHSLMLVGYIKNSTGDAPSKFLVRDPNDPLSIKVLEWNQNQNNWIYEQPPIESVGQSNHAAKDVPVEVAYEEIPNADERQRLAQNFQGSEISPRTSKNQRLCQPSGQATDWSGFIAGFENRTTQR